MVLVKCHICKCKCSGTHPHLGAIWSSQYTFQHVFGRWEEAGEPEEDPEPCETIQKVS